MKNRNTNPELTTTGKLIVGLTLTLGGITVILAILAIIKVFVNYLVG